MPTIYILETTKLNTHKESTQDDQRGGGRGGRNPKTTGQGSNFYLPSTHHLC